MKAKVVILGLLMVGLGCGSSSPEAFIKKQARLSCSYGKKCEESEWEQAGFDNVAECVDELTPEDSVELFADACKDFDKKAARQCLAGMRKAKRKCDIEAADKEQEEACFKVCGEIDIGIGELGRDPGDLELARRVAQLVIERADALSDEDPEPVGLLSE